MYFPPVADFMIDLDGDCRDEVVVWHNNRLQAWGRDLKNRWSIAAKTWQILRLVPGSSGRLSTLVLPPAAGIDGMSGKVRWIYKPPAPENRADVDLLDPGNSMRMPLLVSTRRSFFASICRYALPATPRGDYAPSSGPKPPPGLVQDDPRWRRPLP
jgi:hypothetical protein